MSSKNSEVFSSYLQIADQKGWIKKEAVIEPKAKNLSGNGDLNNDLLVLIAALKERGLDKFANELEQNYVNLKKIETHLYKVHPNGEQDMLEFAHPDGDAKVFQVSENLGDVETLLSAHQQMLNVAKKPALGKLGSQDIVELIKIALKKKADLTTLPKEDVIIKKVMNEKYKKKLSIELLQLLQNIKFHLYEKFNDFAQKFAAKYDIKLTNIINQHLQQIAEVINNTQMLVKNPTEDNFTKISDMAFNIEGLINTIKKNLNPQNDKRYVPNITDSNYQAMIHELNNANAQVKQIIHAYDKIYQMYVKDSGAVLDSSLNYEEEQKKLKSLIVEYKNKISKEYGNKTITVQENAEAQKWLNEQWEKLSDANNLLTVKTELEEFNKVWF